MHGLWATLLAVLLMTCPASSTIAGDGVWDADKGGIDRDLDNDGSWETMTREESIETLIYRSKCRSLWGVQLPLVQLLEGENSLDLEPKRWYKSHGSSRNRRLFMVPCEMSRISSK